MTFWWLVLFAVLVFSAPADSASRQPKDYWERMQDRDDAWFREKYPDWDGNP